LGQLNATSLGSTQTLSPYSGKCTGAVQLFQDAGFDGWKASFTKGDYDNAAFIAHKAKNDDASSIQVPAGCKAVLYQHGDLSGWSATFPPGRYDYAQFLSRMAKNDEASSIKVTDDNGAGFVIQISGGDACHNGDRRAVNITVMCDLAQPDNMPPTRPAVGPIEHHHCSYNLDWKSKYGCPVCTHHDYTVDADLKCGLDGYRSVIHTRASDCIGGCFAGVPMHTEKVPCTASCPPGFMRSGQACTACPIGSYSAIWNATACDPCPAGQFNDETGSSQCFDCGRGTDVRPGHDGCTTSTDGLPSCSYVEASLQWNLLPLASTTSMYPVTDETRATHLYFLNICGGHLNHTCFTAVNEPLVSFACQIPFGWTTAVDLGDTIGYEAMSPSTQYPDGGMIATLTHGDACHHAPVTGDRRKTIITLICDLSVADKGHPVAPPHSDIEQFTAYQGRDVGACVYDFQWRTMYACPVCSDEHTYDVDTERSKCQINGLKQTWLRRTRACYNPDGSPGPVAKSTSGIAACTPECPAGYSNPMKQSPCELCAAGTYSPQGGTACLPCPPGQYSLKAGSESCRPCGEGTTPNPQATDCDTHDCTFSVGGRGYDLSALEKPNFMYSTVQQYPRDDGHIYFLNMCTRQTDFNANLTCFDHNQKPINSFACQRTTHGYAVDLGSTIGFSAPRGFSKDHTILGITVTFTHGKHSSGCDRETNGAHALRSTEVAMICDPFAGVGSPESPATQPVEFPAHTCTYHFEWRSLYACPLCTQDDYEAITGACTNSTNSREVHYMWKSPRMCHGGVALPPVSVEFCTPHGDGPWYTSPGFLITVMAVGGLCCLAAGGYGLLKYYKYRKLYEAYAQLDRNRGTDPDDFAMPMDFELEPTPSTHI